MKIFKLDKEYKAVCQSESTRYGFRHLATLIHNGHETGYKAKCCYYNRTWESFEFESVLHQLINNNAKNDVQKKIWLNNINKRGY